MPTSLESAIALLLLIAPGLLFELGVEKRQPYWRTELTNRVLRFFAWSCLFHSLVLPLSIWAWVHVHENDWQSLGSRIWTIWLVAVVYTFLPLTAGASFGGSSRIATKLRSLTFGRDLPPHAWDHLWSAEGEGFVRVQFKESNLWTAGIWSYSSSYPATDQDLLLDPIVACDEQSGRLLFDDNEEIINTGWALLLNRDDLQRIEYQAFPSLSS